MFYSLSGKIVYKDDVSVAIDCSGIAFRLAVSANTLAMLGDVGESAFVYTYLSVKEDGAELFGFYDDRELKYFKLLTGVSGVGAKTAMAVLSEFTTELLSVSIVAGDAKSLARAQGIGQKTAQRIILELKDKVSRMVPSAMSSDGIARHSAAVLSSKTDEALSALAALGYSYNQAAEAVASLDMSLSVEELIKSALKKLARR